VSALLNCARTSSSSSGPSGFFSDKYPKGALSRVTWQHCPRCSSFVVAGGRAWTCSLSLSVTVTSAFAYPYPCVCPRSPSACGCVGVSANVCVALVACRRFHVNEDCAKGKRQTVATTVNDKQKRNSNNKKNSEQTKVVKYFFVVVLFILLWSGGKWQKL